MHSSFNDNNNNAISRLDRLTFLKQMAIFTNPSQADLTRYFVLFIVSYKDLKWLETLQLFKGLNSSWQADIKAGLIHLVQAYCGY
jgi:hypothetical protein